MNETLHVFICAAEHPPKASVSLFWAGECVHAAVEAVGSSTVSHGGASGAEHWSLTDISVLL